MILWRVRQVWRGFAEQSRTAPSDTAFSQYPYAAALCCRGGSSTCGRIPLRRKCRLFADLCTKNLIWYMFFPEECHEQNGAHIGRERGYWSLTVLTLPRTVSIVSACFQLRRHPWNSTVSVYLPYRINIHRNRQKFTVHGKHQQRLKCCNT